MFHVKHRKEVYMFLSHYGISQKRKEEKEILKIDYSYRYWCDMLFEKCIRILIGAVYYSHKRKLKYV